MGFRSFKRESFDKKVAVRFQTAWVPLDDETGMQQIAPCNFSYQTNKADDPRNLLLVCTPLGVFAHLDGVGFQPLLMQKGYNTQWFKATQSEHQVAQNSNADSPTTLGLLGSGNRENRFLIVTVPLKQKESPPDFVGGCVYRSLALEGVSRAARFEAGDIYGRATTMNVDLVMDPDESIVVTQIDFNTLSGGSVIAKEDVRLAINDMNRQYDMCDSVCKLSELPAMLCPIKPI